MEQVLSSSEGQKIQKSRVSFIRVSNETVFVLACVLCAFLIRLFLSQYESVIDFDGTYYAKLGKKLISGDLSGGISAYWSPLYSFLVGISSLFFQDLEYAGKFVSVIAGAVLIVPSYFLIREFYGQISAFIGTILIVVHPGLIYSALRVLTETLYALIFTTAILVTWYALRSDGKKLSFFFTGLLFGAAYLVKPEAIGFLGLIFVLMFGAEFLRHLRPRILLKNYLFLLIGFSIFFLPYVAFLHQKTGHFTISQKIQNNVPLSDSGFSGTKLINEGQTTLSDKLFGDNYITESQTTRVASSIDNSETNSSSHKINASWLLSKTISNMRKQLSRSLLSIFHVPFPQLFILLIILGFFFQPWTRIRTIKEVYLSSFVICTLVGYAVTVIQGRYLYPILPILIAWIAYSIVQLGHWVTDTGSNLLPNHRRVSPISIQIFATLIISLILIYSIGSTVGYNVSDEQFYQQKQAGLWIKNHTASPKLIMDTSPVASFYAEADHIFLPNEEITIVLDYAKRKKVNYLIVSEQRMKITPEAFPNNKLDLPVHLKLIYQDSQPAGNKILVYQLLN